MSGQPPPLTLWVSGYELRFSKKGNLYSITERKVPEMIAVLGSQPAGDVSHKTDGRLPLLSVRGLLPVLLLGEQRHSGCEQFA